MRRGAIITIISVLVYAAFLAFKTEWGVEDQESALIDAFIVTTGGFLTLFIYSFLYNDNPFYKFAEHLYVGVSAAYWMAQGFWSNIAQQAAPKLNPWLSEVLAQDYQGFDWKLLIPIVLGFLLLTRLLPDNWNVGWMSKWTLAFIVASTSGLYLIANLQTNFIAQVAATIRLPLLPDWQGAGHFFSNFDLSYDGLFIKTFSNWVTIVGVTSGLVYFYFSKEHTGWFGRISRLGIWALMLTFGAAFGYTVMGRVSLLVGRLTFLFQDWAGIIS